MPEVTIDTPKGKFTFPDQAKADAYLKAAGGQAAGPSLADQIANISSAAEKQDSVGSGEYIANRAKKGAATFLGLPGDVVDLTRKLPVGAPVALSHPAGIPLAITMNLVAEKLGLKRPMEDVPTEKVIATSQMYRDAMGYQPDMQAPGDLTRIVGGATEMLAAGGPVGLTALPGRVLPAAIAGTTRMRASQLPALAYGSASSGLGLEVGGDISEGFGFSRTPGEVLGAVAGSAAPAVAGANLPRMVDWVKGRFSPTANRARAEAAITEDMRRTIEQYPAAQQNLAQAESVKGEFKRAGVPLNVSVPQATGAPDLLAKENALMTNDPRVLNRVASNIEQNAAAADAFVELKFPVTSGESAARRVQRLQLQASGKLDAQLNATNKEIDALTAAATDRPPTAASGEKLRDLYFKQKTAYTAQRKKIYDNVDAVADDIAKTPVIGPQFRRQVAADLQDMGSIARKLSDNELAGFTPAELPQSIRDAMRKYGAEPGRGDRVLSAQRTGGGTTDIIEQPPAGATRAGLPEASFSELQGLLKQVNRNIASTQGSNAITKDAHLDALNKFGTELRMKLAAYEGEQWGNLGSSLRDANNWYRTEYVPRFKQGFGGDIRQKYATGEFRTPNEKIVDQIAQSNNSQAAKDFNLVFGESPEAWKALRDGYMDSFFRRAGTIKPDGSVSQTALDNFIRSHQGTLNELPQVRGDLQRLAVDNSALLERRAEIQGAIKEMHAAELYKMFQGRNPDEIVANAFKDEKAMRLLAQSARGTEARSQAFARTIAENVMGQKDPAAYFAANEDIIRAGLSPLGPEHFKNLKTAMDALNMNARTVIPNPSGSRYVDTSPLGTSTGTSARGVVQHLLSVERGRSSPLSEGTAFLARWFDKLRGDHQAVVMENVFYDTDTSAVMARLAKSSAQTTEAVKARWAEQMAVLGIRAEAAAQD